jgi:ATP adenylyltransferase
VSLDTLWAGWRSIYVDSATATGPPSAEEAACLFCRLQQGADDEMLVLERTPHTFTVMNAYPYTNGHVMVAPLRHEASLAGLSAPGEGPEMFAALQRAETAIRRAYEPHAINVGANLGHAAGAGVPGHVHLHALPRWSGDTNFMTAIANTRVMPESLRSSWERLRAAWPSVA